MLLPLDLIIALCIAVFIHEFCHILLLYLFDIPILHIDLRIGGAAIQTAALPVIQELFCALAGPAGSFLCLLFLRRFPLLALCGYVQGLYNLLPVYPLDGGRILHCLCLLFLPNHAARICKFIENCVTLSVLLISFLLCLHTKDWVYIFPAGYFLIQIGTGRKSPCKEQYF